MPLLRVLLQPGERDALYKLAGRERRDPRAQAALIIRQALESAGLIPANSAAEPWPAVLTAEVSHAQPQS